MPDDFDFFNEEAKPKPKAPRQPERVEKARPPRAEPEIEEECAFDDEPPVEREPPRRASKPAARAKRHEDDERDRGEEPARKKGLSPLILAAIAGGALLVVGGGVAILIAAREKDPERKEKEKSVVAATSNQSPVVVPKKDMDPNTPTPETVARVKKATVLIRVQYKDGKQASGSGFVEKTSGLVVTNAHVVGLLSSKDSRWAIINLVVNSGEGDKEYTLAGVVEEGDYDSENDLAIIHPKIIEVGERHVVPDGLVVPKNPGLVELQNLVVFGFPLGTQLGAEISVRPTKVSSIRKDPKDPKKLKYIQVEGAMTHGNSGGPVIDTKGNVVGVAVAGIQGENINLAIPSEKVVELLARRKK
jgi:S1-C subfamily serine protease